MNPAIPQDIPALRPVLLMSRNEETGKWRYKRTNGPWFGGFEIASDAMCAAEQRFGWLPRSYTVQFDEGRTDA